MKNYKLRRYLLLPLVLSPLAWLLSCSHQTAEISEIDRAAVAQPSAPVGGQFAVQSRRAIEESSTIDAAQKGKLLELHQRLAGQARTYQEEMGKLKMLLVKSLVDPQTENKRISNIKNKIVELDRLNVKQMLDGFEEARTILGRRQPGDESLFRAFMMDRVPLDTRP